MKPHRGTLILVLGILSLIVCEPLGIVAWIMGNSDLREIDAGIMDPAGRSLTQAGRVCGMIACILMILSALVGALVLFMGVLNAGAQWRPDPTGPRHTSASEVRAFRYLRSLIGTYLRTVEPV